MLKVALTEAQQEKQSLAKRLAQLDRECKKQQLCKEQADERCQQMQDKLDQVG